VATFATGEALYSRAARRGIIPNYEPFDTQRMSLKRLAAIGLGRMQRTGHAFQAPMAVTKRLATAARAFPSGIDAGTITEGSSSQGPLRDVLLLLDPQFPFDYPLDASRLKVSSSSLDAIMHEAAEKWTRALKDDKPRLIDELKRFPELAGPSKFTVGSLAEVGLAVVKSFLDLQAGGTDSTHHEELEPVLDAFAWMLADGVERAAVDHLKSTGGPSSNNSAKTPHPARLLRAMVSMLDFLDDELNRPNRLFYGFPEAVCHAAKRVRAKAYAITHKRILELLAQGGLGPVTASPKMLKQNTLPALSLLTAAHAGRASPGATVHSPVLFAALSEHAQACIKASLQNIPRGDTDYKRYLREHREDVLPGTFLLRLQRIDCLDEELLALALCRHRIACYPAAADFSDRKLSLCIAHALAHVGVPTGNAFAERLAGDFLSDVLYNDFYSSSAVDKSTPEEKRELLAGCCEAGYYRLSYFRSFVKDVLSRVEATPTLERDYSFTWLPPSVAVYLAAQMLHDSFLLPSLLAGTDAVDGEEQPEASDGDDGKKDDESGEKEGDSLQRRKKRKAVSLLSALRRLHEEQVEAIKGKGLNKARRIDVMATNDNDIDIDDNSTTNDIDIENDPYDPWGESFHFQKVASKLLARKKLPIAGEGLVTIAPADTGSGRASNNDTLHVYDCLDVYNDEDEKEAERKLKQGDLELRGLSEEDKRKKRRAMTAENEARLLLRDVVLRHVGFAAVHGLEPVWFKQHNVLVLVEPPGRKYSSLLPLPVREQAAAAEKEGVPLAFLETEPYARKIIYGDIDSRLTPRAKLHEKALQSVLLPIEKPPQPHQLTIIRIPQGQLVVNQHTNVVDEASVDAAFERAGVWKKLLPPAVEEGKPSSSA
jgi:hypothetical protein